LEVARLVKLKCDLCRACGKPAREDGSSPDAGVVQW
jgi:hypothetical protein